MDRKIFIKGFLALECPECKKTAYFEGDSNSNKICGEDACECNWILEISLKKRNKEVVKELVNGDT